jgi:hypothetical protein
MILKRKPKDDVYDILYSYIRKESHTRELERQLRPYIKKRFRGKL